VKAFSVPHTILNFALFYFILTPWVLPVYILEYGMDGLETDKPGGLRLNVDEAFGFLIVSFYF